jgi:4-amino-4-deoxy-L-arabinose transferase-like glycosyltransferase
MQTERAPDSARGSRWEHRWELWALLAVAALGLGLRLDGLGERMLSHPENFAPGLDMPEWVRFPPPRHDLVSVLRGTLIDGHPPTYFVALLGWAKVFGGSLVSLRLPSALLGALSILLVYRLARREGSRWTALLAAGLLATSGFHVYWSQLARMYVPAAFLALVSTLFLVRLRERGRRADQLGYLVATVLALWTHLYAWPLVFAQIVAATLRAVRERRAPEALRVQVLAVVAGLPTVQLSMFQNPPSRWHEPVAEYFGFGYLFYSRAPFFGDRPAPPVAPAWLIAIGLLLVALGLFRRRSSSPVAEPTPLLAPLRWLEWGIGLATTAVLAAFATYTLSRPKADPIAMWTPVLVPIPAVLWLPWIERRSSSLARRPPAALARVALDVPQSLVLAVLPVLCMAAVSLVRGAFVARGTVVFLPFLIIAATRGVEVLGRVRPVGLATAALVLVLHLASVRYFERAQSSPQDYRGLAERLVAQLEETDLVLVENDFSYPPLIYYLRSRAGQLVPADYSAAVARAPDSRVWLLHLTNAPVSQEMLAAVEPLEQRSTIDVVGARALLHVPRDDGTE